ncbi:MAG: hypothetical protein IE918_05395 [Campylobacterales bacterium]|nr:hypothetical protein [Campylobacterales bacterium]
MSIKNISKETRVKVLIRLLKNNESFEDACSKSALSIKEAKQFLAQN